MWAGIIADDLTGASDCGAQLVRAGYRTAVIFCGEKVPEDLDAVVLDTDSRTKPAGFAARRVVEAGHAVRDAHIVYKKLDSTLRGPITAELSAALGATRRERVVVAPAFPAAGRTTVSGTQLVHGVPVHETEMKNDSRTPVREGHIPTLLREAFSSVGTLGVEDLVDLDLVRRVLEESECVVVDAERDRDLEALVRAVPDSSAVLWTGSAGLALALGGVYPGPHGEEAIAASGPTSKVLVVIGSLSGVAREQLRQLVEEHGEVAVPVYAGKTGALEEAAGRAREALSGGRCAILHSPAERGDSGTGGSFVASLAETVEALSRDAAFDALVLTGGSTAVGVARRLGATGIRLEGEVEVGVPVGTLIGPRTYRVVTKAGGFGGPDTLVGAVEALAQSGEE